MNISIILAHPETGSFNAAIAGVCRDCCESRGHRVYFHDLYREKFDPVLEAAEIPRDAVLGGALAPYCEELLESNGIIVIHPNWWGQPPALLKGWVDRVFRPGVAYEFLEGDSGEGVPRGLLNAQWALVLNTSNTAREREEALFGDPLDRLWTECIFRFCGVPRIYRKMFSIVVSSTREDRLLWLEEVRAMVEKALDGSIV